jgi:serine/threonine protein kinase
MDNGCELAGSLAEGPVDLAASAGPDLTADESLRASVLRLLDQQTASDFRPGDVVGGRFRILKELGAGGIGTVFLAKDRQLGEVALKILHPELAKNRGAAERLAKEVRVARSIRHPNLRPAFDLFRYNRPRKTPIVAATMQYLRGETLSARLSRGAIAATEAIPIAKGIAAGIDALHGAGIVHRDLKPGNIMLIGGREGAAKPVIMDFGLATDRVPSAIEGSPDYMAPEQFRAAAATPAADIYAFGLILFEMIAGRRPFPSEDLLPAAIRRNTEDAPRLSAVAPSAPHAWTAPIALALARDPADRPNSATELVQRMLRGSASGPVVLDRRCCHGQRRIAVRGVRARRF